MGKTKQTRNIKEESEDPMANIFPVLKKFISDARSFLRMGEAKVDQRTEDFCKEGRNELVKKMISNTCKESPAPFPNPRENVMQESSAFAAEGVSQLVNQPHQEQDCPSFTSWGVDGQGPSRALFTPDPLFESDPITASHVLKRSPMFTAVGPFPQLGGVQEHSNIRYPPIRYPDTPPPTAPQPETRSIGVGQTPVDRNEVGVGVTPAGHASIGIGNTPVGVSSIGVGRTPLALGSIGVGQTPRLGIDKGIGQTPEPEARKDRKETGTGLATENFSSPVRSRGKDSERSALGTVQPLPSSEVVGNMCQDNEAQSDQEEILCSKCGVLRKPGVFCCSISRKRVILGDKKARRTRSQVKESQEEDEERRKRPQRFSDKYSLSDPDTHPRPAKRERTLSQGSIDEKPDVLVYNMPLREADGGQHETLNETRGLSGHDGEQAASTLDKTTAEEVMAEETPVKTTLLLRESQERPPKRRRLSDQDSPTDGMPAEDGGNLLRKPLQTFGSREFAFPKHRIQETQVALAPVNLPSWDRKLASCMVEEKTLEISNGTETDRHTRSNFLVEDSPNETSGARINQQPPQQPGTTAQMSNFEFQRVHNAQESPLAASVDIPERDSHVATLSKPCLEGVQGIHTNADMVKATTQPWLQASWGMVMKHVEAPARPRAVEDQDETGVGKTSQTDHVSFALPRAMILREPSFGQQPEEPLAVSAPDRLPEQGDDRERQLQVRINTEDESLGKAQDQQQQQGLQGRLGNLLDKGVVHSPRVDVGASRKAVLSPSRIPSPPKAREEPSLLERAKQFVFGGKTTDKPPGGAKTLAQTPPRKQPQSKGGAISRDVVPPVKVEEVRSFITMGNETPTVTMASGQHKVKVPALERARALKLKHEEAAKKRAERRKRLEELKQPAPDIGKEAGTKRLAAGQDYGQRSAKRMKPTPEKTQVTGTKALGGPSFLKKNQIPSEMRPLPAVATAKKNAEEKGATTLVSTPVMLQPTQGARPSPAPGGSILLSEMGSALALTQYELTPPSVVSRFPSEDQKQYRNLKRIPPWAQPGIRTMDHVKKKLDTVDPQEVFGGVPESASNTLDLYEVYGKPDARTQQRWIERQPGDWSDWKG